MTAPVRADIGDRLKTVRDTMVDLLCVVVLIGSVNQASKRSSVHAHTPVFDFEIHLVTTLS